MGLIRGIAEAVLEKAKVEMKDYLIKFIEAEKESGKQTEKESVEEEKKTETEPVSGKTEEKIETTPEKKKEIFPLIEKDFVKILFKTKPDIISIPLELADLMQMLPIEEFACFIKLFIFVTEQKKNFGYLGNNLKKRIGLDELSSEKFDEITGNLVSYGLMKIEQVSDNQKTFILYIPFDEETMTVSEMQKQEKAETEKQGTKKKSSQKETEKKGSVRTEKKEENKEETETAKLSPEDEELYKSYRTFVNLEIDKAKMRVGRSNFDKIYMEAVKYIDKKYGFKVLSDSEKFKEHLTDYYISAFDIKSFDEWKKSK